MMSTIANQGRPVPLMMPLRRGSPQNPRLGEASETPVRPLALFVGAISPPLAPILPLSLLVVFTS